MVVDYVFCVTYYLGGYALQVGFIPSCVPAVAWPWKAEGCVRAPVDKGPSPEEAHVRHEDGRGDAIRGVRKAHQQEAPAARLPHGEAVDHRSDEGEEIVHTREA